MMRLQRGSGLGAARSAVLLVALLEPGRARAGAEASVCADAVAGIGTALPPGSLVVAAPFTSDAPAPRGEDLAVHLAAVVAGRVGKGARSHGRTVPLATARTLARRAGALIYLRPVLSSGDLHLSVDVYPAVANAWERIRTPTPAPVSHATASASVDASVRVFLAPLVLEQARIERVRHEEGDVLAVACGDADADGRSEVLLVSRTGIALGRPRGGAFVVEKTAAWNDLAPRVPVATRELLATAVVTPGLVAVGSTDRGGVAMTSGLEGHRPLLGVPVWGGDRVVCLTPQPAAGAFDGAPVDCALSADPKPVMVVPSPRFDAFGAAVIADSTGSSTGVVAVREPSGRLRIRRGDGVLVPDGTFGAQLAVADLDQDGVPELAVTADSASGTSPALPWRGRNEDGTSPAPPGRGRNEDDLIVIMSLDPGASEPRVRLRVPAPAGVRALAMCPPQQDAAPALAAVVGGELWLVRPSPSLRSRPGDPGDAPSRPAPPPGARPAAPGAP